jgi:hypothetical protein
MSGNYSEKCSSDAETEKFLSKQTAHVRTDSARRKIAAKQKQPPVQDR